MVRTQPKRWTSPPPPTPSQDRSIEHHNGSSSIHGGGKDRTPMGVSSLLGGEVGKKEPTPSPVSHREDDECQPRSGGGRRTITRKRSSRIQPDGSVPSYESTGWNGWWRRGNGCHAHRRNRRNQTEAWILRCRKKIPSLWRRWSRRKSVSRQRDICIRSKKLACFGKEVAPFPDPSVDAKATRDKSVRDR